MRSNLFSIPEQSEIKTNHPAYNLNPITVQISYDLLKVIPLQDVLYVMRSIYTTIQFYSMKYFVMPIISTVFCFL